MFKKFFAVALFSVVSLTLSASVWAAGFKTNNYTADIETVTGKQKNTSKMYAKDTKQRMETNSGGRDGIMIIRLDKKVMWMLMPTQKMYMEMPIDRKNMTAQMNDPSVKVDKKFISNETVDGHPCKKYHVDYISNGKKENSGFQWEANDLDNFPIKVQDEKTSSTTTWRNIKFGTASDSQFEVPAGYKKMSMPGGMRMPR